MTGDQPLKEPAWPIIVLEDDWAGVYDRDVWFGDADLCDAGTWSDTTRVIDSEGTEFRIEHRCLREGRWLGLIPFEEVTNVFVPTGGSESVAGLLERLRAACPPSVFKLCERTARESGPGEALRGILEIIRTSA